MDPIKAQVLLNALRVIEEYESPGGDGYLQRHQEKWPTTERAFPDRLDPEIERLLSGIYREKCPKQAGTSDTGKALRQNLRRWDARLRQDLPYPAFARVKGSPYRTKSSRFGPGWPIETRSEVLTRMGNDYSSWLAQGNCTRLTSFYFSATSRWRTVGTGADSSKKGGEPQSFFSIDAWQWWSRQVTLEPEDLPEAIIVAGMASSAALQGVRNFLAPAVSTAAQTAEAALGLLFIRVPEDSIPSRPDSA